MNGRWFRRALSQRLAAAQAAGIALPGTRRAAVEACGL